MGRSCDTPILYLPYTNYNTRTACSSMDKKIFNYKKDQELFKFTMDKH